MKKLLILAALCYMAWSCGKRHSNEDLTDAGANSALCEAIFSDMSRQFETANAKIETNNSIVFQGPCATITVTPADTTTWPKTITIDFGTTGCVDLRGFLHKGKLICQLTGRYKNQGSICTITPSNYSVNGYGVTGTKTITNIGRNSSNQLSFHVVVTNATITNPNNQTSTWESDRTEVWTGGENTPYPNYGDDRYEISGKGNGSNNKGESYSMQTLTPLHVAMDCRYITQGKLSIHNANHDSAVVDYGNTGCDANAELIIRGKTYPITLK